MSFQRVRIAAPGAQAAPGQRVHQGPWRHSSHCSRLLAPLSPSRGQAVAAGSDDAWPGLGLARLEELQAGV